MKYIMVTDFPNHWDKIKGNLTSYPPKMVKKFKTEKLKSGIKTIFIKIQWQQRFGKNVDR